MTTSTRPIQTTGPILSAAASNRLETELAALVEERTLRATEPIDATGDAADLAEFAARDMLLERLDVRIADIRGLLAEASFPAQRTSDDTVATGDVVELRFGAARTVETFLLGHLAEAGGGFEVITPQSPLGRALAGARTGETVQFGTPRGEVAVTIVGLRAF
jgi:transcription elongation factor GreA